jgi:GTPase SAR1 family protein
MSTMDETPIVPHLSNEDIKRKFNRFRILIIGRANSGKTTILQKICGTTEKPQIYDSKGKKVEIL